MTQCSINGRWYCTSSERIEDFMKAMGCPMEVMNKMLPILTSTGEHGHIEEYIVDTTRKCVRRCTYHRDNLVREYCVPLDMEVPGWSLKGGFMRMKIHCDGNNKLMRTETGDNYTLTVCAEINGDNCTTTWTCNNVPCVLKFKKIY